jgi:ribosomal protein L18E
MSRLGHSGFVKNVAAVLKKMRDNNSIVHIAKISALTFWLKKAVIIIDGVVPAVFFMTLQKSFE